MRMRQGEPVVVDAELAHLDLESLFVPGGGAFSTYSAAHPALSMAALAIRAGERIVPRHPVIGVSTHLRFAGDRKRFCSRVHAWRRRVDPRGLPMDSIKAEPGRPTWAPGVAAGRDRAVDEP